MALYRGLFEAVGYPINYHFVGAIRSAHIPERTEGFKHVRAMGDLQGLRVKRMSCDTIKAAYPIGETHDLVGGL